MAVDARYGKVTVEHEPGNPLGEDEPVFVLRARDVVAPGTVERYAQDCEFYGAPTEHVESIRRAAVALQKWQDANPDLVKTPD